MKKAEFIKKFSKIEDTFEDEFIAEFNSPELIWEALKEQLTPNEGKDNEIKELKRMLKEVKSYLDSFKLLWNEAEKMLTYKIESLISKK